MRVIIPIIVFMMFITTLASSDDLIAEKVVVAKAKRKMWLMKDGKPIREYQISLDDNPIGHKQQQGDEKTPEGQYLIDYRNPNSSYHLSPL